MFGYTAPKKLDLTLKDNYLYKAHYCGVCGALRNHHLFFRLATSYEATLLSLLLAAQNPNPPQQTRLFCPFSGEFGRGVVIDAEECVSFAAEATLLMGYYKLNDQKRDQPKTAIFIKPLEKTLQASKDRLYSFGLDIYEFDRLEKLQIKLEQKDKLNLDDILMPTSRALGLVLSFTAELTKTYRNKENLYALGEALGKLIYIFDSIDDWENDKKRNGFNGLKASGFGYAYGLLELEYVLKRLLHVLADNLAEIYLQHYESIFHNIIHIALPQKAKQKISILKDIT